MEFIRETERDIPVTHRAEVVVAGGGPAGAMAAIAAGRLGVRTLLIERAGCAGGIWTSGLLSWMLDVTNKGGLLKELMNSIREKDEGDHAREGNFITFPETVKLELDSMLLAAGVEVLYYTQVTGCQKDGDRITHVITESKAGRGAVSGKIFIDATGDGDLSAFASCRFEIGRGENRETQPGSLIALMTGVHAEDVRKFNNSLPYLPGKNAKAELLEEMARAGISPSYQAPSFFHIKDDIWLVMTTHCYAIDALDPASLTERTMEARRELKRQEQALRALGGPWRDLRVIATAPYVGIRECRRIAGKYTVTAEDALCGRTHEDAVCRVEFPLDVHPLSHSRTSKMEHGGLKAKPFDIPLRALESADVENLLLAGRLISGDFLAHSSYRVSGDAAAIGEAAGTAAALAVQKNVTPGEVPFEELKKVIG